MARHSRRCFLQGSLALGGLGLLAGCGQVSLPWQQPARVPRIGFLGFSPDSALAEVVRQGLRELGWVEGRTIAIEYRPADGQIERLPDLAAELVRLPVDVIVAAGGPQGALAAKQATDTIPIVFTAAADPVSSGLVASLARPGGNATGLTVSAGAGIASKRLDLLREVVPGLSRVDILRNPDLPGAQPFWAELEAAAQALGVMVRVREARGPDELDGAFAAIAAERPDGLMVGGDPSFFPHARRIADFAAGRRLPTMCQWRDFVEAGCLMMYGVSFADLYRRAATYVDKILKGTKPAELPVERPTKFDHIVNLKTARALGLTIPESVLQQATELIQ